MATSFPFLQIARTHNIPYGAVVRIAEAMPLLARGKGELLDQQTALDFDTYRHAVLIDDIIIAILEERERRKANGRI